MNIAKAYITGRTIGWAEAIYPGIAKEQFKILSDRGVFIAGLKDPVKAPEYFSLHRVARKAIGKDVGGRRQEIGDPFAAGTLVTMADGTEKPIETVKIGETVVNHKGEFAKVTNVIKKQFTGDMITVKLKGWHREITATETHHGMVLPYSGKRFKFNKCERSKFGEMKESDYMLLPWGHRGTETITLDLADYIDNAEISAHKICHKGSRKECNRYISVDADFGYLIGLYLAEGGLSTNRCSITFSLNKNETRIIRKLYHLSAKVFGIRPTTEKTGNDNCVRVAIHSKTLATFISKFVSGNIKTKRVPVEFFKAYKAARKGLFTGWVDGDGYVGKTKNAIVGYTISENLAYDMAKIGLSLKCRLTTRTRNRKSDERNYNTSYEVSVYSSEITKVYDEAVLTKTKEAKCRVTPYGLAVKIDKITKTSVVDETVYCITTENEYTAVFNGIAQYQCVSWGMKHAAEHLACCDIVMRGENEIWHEVFAPYYYGTGRVYIGKGQLGNQDGSLGSWMAEAAIKYGTIYEDMEGVPPYSGNVAKAWGDPNPRNDLDNFKDMGMKHLVKGGTQVKSFQELCDYIANGYPCTVASSQGFQMEPGRDGYHEASGNWAHQMMFYGYGQEYGLIQNSWGNVHGQLKDFHSDDILPVGTIRARRSVVERMINAGETFAFTNIDSFKGQDLPKALFKLIGN